MGYGAMLTDDQGVPFYIDGTRPLTLINTITVNFTAGSGTVQSQALFNADGAVRFMFIQSDNSNLYSAEWISLVNGVWVLYSTNTTKQVKVFVFGYANQTPPAWGIAIWDASGNCILTNETKPLRDVNKLGDISSDSNSGYNINTTKSGSWAVAPTFTGIINGVNQSTGQPVSVILWFYASAYFDGTNTLIRSHTHGSTSGLTSATYVNARNTLTAINVSRY